MDTRLYILEDAFKKQFEQERFLRFATEFFGDIKMVNPDRDIKSIPKEYEYTVKSYRHIATYTSDGDTLDVYTVKLQSGRGRTVERARSMQRSFISKLLTTNNRDAAIAALSPSYDELRWGEAKQKDPRPLPNLDYNIMCGNSLIDEFEGLQLFDDTLLEKDNHDTTGAQTNVQLSLFADSMDTYLDDLRREQERLFGEENHESKLKIKHNIDKIIDNIIRAKLERDNNTDGLQKYEEVLKRKTKPYFLWKLEFARVFRENGGFDVVIGNPPYVDSENMVKNMLETREYYTGKFKVAKGNWDLFVLFIELGHLLSANKGGVAFIVPNKLIAADYAKATRKLMSEMSIQEVRDYSDVRVFLEAAVYPVTFVSCRGTGNENVAMLKMKSLNEIGWGNNVKYAEFHSADNWDSYFSEKSDSIEIIKKMQVHTPLDTVAVVKGAATVSEAYELKKIILDDVEYDDTYFKFINTGTIDRYVSSWKTAKTQYIKQGYYMPLISKEALKALYPKRFIDASSSKIIIGGMTKVLECYLDEGVYLAGKSTVIIIECTIDIKYLVGLLNSKLMTFFYRTYFNSLSLAGGFFRIGAPQIKQLPIFSEKHTLVVNIASKVSDIIFARNSDSAADTSALEAEIDRMIYELYGLTEDEIKIVEESAK